MPSKYKIMDDLSIEGLGGINNINLSNPYLELFYVILSALKAVSCYVPKHEIRQERNP